MSEFVVKPERPGGFLDFLPQDFLAREKMLQTIERIFRSFGFDPIETPRIEFKKTLAGETSDTGKNIFHIKHTDDDEPLALPFDHTVPFARILAANPYNARGKTGIRLPWRRMVVGPVFRSDNPQQGRFRQFYQFDADIAGATSMMADAEIVALMAHTMKSLKVTNFRIRLNNRKILNGLSSLCKINDRPTVSQKNITQEMMRILDKLDKIGKNSVLKELKRPPETPEDPAPHLSDDAVARIASFLDIQGTNSEKIASCRKLFDGIEIAMEGISELEEILSYLEAMSISLDDIQIDFSIARGLDYYTGPVMEMELIDAPQFGSVFSGGRYNNLVTRFTGKELPAVGASIGVDRLFAALDYLKAIDRSQQTVTDVMIIRIARDHDTDYLNIAQTLRQAGIRTEISLIEDTTFKRQFNFAISRGVRYIVICGEDEFKKQSVQVKNLETRKQEELPLADLVSYMRQLS
ncbi:histidyl-tRNA synthase [Candidatus Magnetomorum sp. HK-1]|nr:histidyl-tRNA synthase [Candidatus Magnetomorum sp. HK-1]